MKRLAVLLDGGFLKYRLRGQLKHFPMATDLEAFVRDTVAKIPDHELFRAYYYDAQPYDGSAHNPIDKSHLAFKKSQTYIDNDRLIEQASLLPNFAVRLGECVLQGWDVDGDAIEAWQKLPAATQQSVNASDLRPRIKQRGVDLRIGLDIAHLTNLRLVETVCLVTGDSDFIPALKYARRGGLRVILHTCGGKVYSDLKKHADLVIG